jgi:hypothetical protein
VVAVRMARTGGKLQSARRHALFIPISIALIYLGRPFGAHSGLKVSFASQRTGSSSD